MRLVGRSRPQQVTMVAVVLATTLLAALLPADAPVAAAASDYVANCSVNLRSSPSTAGSVVAQISSGTYATVSGTVSGGSWSADCVSSVSGSSWFSVTAVNGQSVSSRYGVDVVYAATGLFSAAPTGPSLEGIDVSTWQGSIDWAKVKGAGKRFAIAKATEGIGYLDPKYAKNKSGAMSNGLAFTGYHFARPDLNPKNAADEADWFVDNLGLLPGMLTPALDLEVRGGLGTSALQNWVATWLGRVYARTGARPMIYTSPAFWKSYLDDTPMFALEGYTVLWVAHWGVSKPTVPANNWGGKGWTFWQYTSDGSVPGISGRVDLDRYNGIDFTRVTFGADFALEASPKSQSIRQGRSASYIVDLGRKYFTLPIDLSVSGLPTGSKASFSADPASGSTATLTVTTSNSGTVTPTGSYTLTITGSANGRTRSTKATLEVRDGIAPSLTAPSSRLYFLSTLTGAPVTTRWSASDASGIAGYRLQRKLNAGSWETVSLSSATATSIKQALSRGDTWRYRVRATDPEGNTSAYAYGSSFTPKLVQQSSSAVTYGGTWRTVSDGSYAGGSVKTSKSAGSWASYTFKGASVGWIAELGPSRGKAKVYVDGVYKATVNLHASSYQARRVVYAANWASNGTHTLKIVVLGTADHPRVDVDAFLRLVQT